MSMRKEDSIERRDVDEDFWMRKGKKKKVDKIIREIGDIRNEVEIEIKGGIVDKVIEEKIERKVEIESEEIFKMIEVVDEGIEDNGIELRKRSEMNEDDEIIEDVLDEFVIVGVIDEEEFLREEKRGLEGWGLKILIERKKVLKILKERIKKELYRMNKKEEEIESNDRDIGVVKEKKVIEVEIRKIVKDIKKVGVNDREKERIVEREVEDKRNVVGINVMEGKEKIINKIVEENIIEDGIGIDEVEEIEDSVEKEMRKGRIKEWKEDEGLGNEKKEEEKKLIENGNRIRR